MVKKYSVLFEKMTLTIFYTVYFVTKYQNVLISMYFSEQLIERHEAGDDAIVCGVSVCLGELRPDFLSEASGRD